ncbi:MAG: ATP-binding protein [Chlamydiales bacterium]|jgi:chromosomal replication initiator protein|nr:ATP-binding protein [Chlamydiales bacterium]
MQAWEEFLKKQEDLLGKQTVNQWLRSLKILHFDAVNLYLEAADAFHMLWFEEHMRPLIKTHLLNNNSRTIKVHLHVPDKAVNKKKEKTQQVIEFSPLADQLDPIATLANFVPAKANEVVMRLCCELTGVDPVSLRFTSSPNLATYNPIFLWGKAGTGKTHLLMALTHLFCQRGFKALFVRSETFTEHVISAIRSSEMQKFREIYRHLDALLIDDIHLFMRKDATQEEFFHLFNTLHLSNKQIILSSKVSPSQLEEIEPRLISRFEWGIVLQLSELTEIERKKLLIHCCKTRNFPLTEKICSFLVQTFSNNHSLLRAFEALLLRIYLKDKNFKPNQLQLAQVEVILSDLIQFEQKKTLNKDIVLSAVASYFDIDPSEITGKSQSQRHTFPRQISIYLCRTLLKLSFTQIGRIFSRDHSTAVTAVKQIKVKLENRDKELQEALKQIETIAVASLNKEVSIPDALTKRSE